VDHEAYELRQQLQISVPVFCLASFSIGWIVTVCDYKVMLAHFY
jgi:hypothetical protein